jgi:hypothetical protein
MDQTTTTTATTTVVQPKTPKVVVRVSNIENLLKSAKTLNVTSRKIRRTFEKNTYQKRTQLSVLKRYKRRLDSIEKQEEERRKKASKKKIKLPSIKKFAGSFFAPDASKDPLKAIATLAAFKGLEKLSQGNILGAIGPGLIAAGLVAGPSLLGAGVDKVFNRTPKVRRGFDTNGRRVSAGAQQRYLNRYGDKAFKRRFGRSAPQQGTAAARTVSGGGRTAKAFGRLGKSIIPGVGAVLGAVDAKMRAEEGDITGSRIAGASATLDTLTAASAATGIGLVATPFLGLASITLDLINFARDIAGMSENEAKKKKGIQTKLEEQTKKQKESVNKPEQNKAGLSFAKTLVGYEKVVNKFEEFSKNFKPTGAEYDLNEEVSPTEFSEPNDYGEDTGDYGSMSGTLSSDILEFRKFRNEKFGASKERFATASPRLYQVRELGIWEGGKTDNWRINPLADDTAYEKNEHAGAGHWENRAFDIPVPDSSRQGDMVAEFWRKKGYRVIWKSSGHYDHVHVEVPAEKAKDFFSGKLNQPPAQPAPSQPRRIGGEGSSAYTTGDEVMDYTLDVPSPQVQPKVNRPGRKAPKISQYPSYNNPSNTFIISMNPPSQSPSIAPGGSPPNPTTYIRSLNNDRVIALSMFDSIG